VKGDNLSYRFSSIEHRIPPSLFKSKRSDYPSNRGDLG